MLLQQKLGNISSLSTDSSINDLAIDNLSLEWYETDKRILHAKTEAGTQVTLKFLDRNPDFKDGDIVWKDENKMIVVDLKRCECIVIKSRSVLEAAAICYEIGNRHLPLFYEENQLLTPYDAPLFGLLQAKGYELKIEERKLSNRFRTTVMPHIQVSEAVSSLISATKIQR
ncbi:MAG: urease accessory protein UreE [Ginsengibacter sp.]